MDDFFETIDRLKAQTHSASQIGTVRFEDSAMGKQLAELQGLRSEVEKQNKELEKQRSEQAAEQATAKHREKIAEIRGFFLGVLGSVVAGLIVEYWPAITSLFSH